MGSYCLPRITPPDHQISTQCVLRPAWTVGSSTVCVNGVRDAYCGANSWRKGRFCFRGMRVRGTRRILRSDFLGGRPFLLPWYACTGYETHTEERFPWGRPFLLPWYACTGYETHTVERFSGGKAVFVAAVCE